MIMVLLPVLASAIFAGIWAGTKSIKKRIKLNKKLKRLMDSRAQYDFLLCDVRPERYYITGHIPGAVSFPLEEMDYLPVEDMFLTIIIYGKNRKDTRRAAAYLSRNGYFNVIAFGGIRHWKGPLEQSAGQHISQNPPAKESLDGARIGSSGL